MSPLGRMHPSSPLLEKPVSRVSLRRSAASYPARPLHPPRLTFTQGRPDVAPRPYRVLSNCAGVGGLELGIRIARPGARGVCYIEREVPAAAVLAARMRDGSLHPAPIWSDLTTFDGRPWRGLVDCFASGDPCQPNSVAGKQLGKDDDRWLLDHVLRIIEEVRPARVFRENVPGNMDGQLEALVPSLERMGFRVAAGIFSAGEDAEANHLRRRLFIMADRDGARCAAAGSGPEIDARRKPLPGSGSVADARGSGSPPIAGDVGEVRGLPEAQRQSEHGAAVSGRSGAGLANADGGHAGAEREQLRRQQRLLASGDGDRLDLADPRGEGLQGIWSGGDTQGRQDPHGHAGLEGRAGLLFAPGPADPVWSQIIGSAPHLAPAVADVDVAAAVFAEQMGPEGDEAQAQSVLRRLDARLAQRVDRLREGGNGVSSLAAAVAWRTLEATHEADRRRSAQHVRLRAAA
ncbi:MAG: DNA cytosine methyltransferase [Brevundimonas sp.]|nr:MAG: DNA cytosine methyltransferase [Brevundimonas sp.]